MLYKTITKIFYYNCFKDQSILVARKVVARLSTSDVAGYMADRQQPRVSTPIYYMSTFSRHKTSILSGELQRMHSLDAADWGIKKLRVFAIWNLLRLGAASKNNERLLVSNYEDA